MQNTSQIDNYIENRNRFHFRQPFQNSYPALMSKSAAKVSQLFRRRHHSSEWKKVSVDILSLLNPLLVTIPFANPQINEFLQDSTKTSILYNYPSGNHLVSQKCEPSKYVPMFREDAQKGDFIFEPSSIIHIANVLSNISLDFQKVIGEQLKDVLANPRGNTIVFRWWSLFWVMEILEGRGDLRVNNLQFNI
jgi:hypothetical protein